MNMRAERLVAIVLPPSAKRSDPAPRPDRLRHLDFKWGLAFVAPYAAMIMAFAVPPLGRALWIAGEPSLYPELIADPLYLPTLVNTLIFVGLGANVKMFVALLLSGFFLRRRLWIKVLLVVYILPWLIATAQVGISFHWMLQGEFGLVDGLLAALFGIDGLIWLN